MGSGLAITHFFLFMAFYAPERHLYALASRWFQIENLTEKLLGPSFLWLIIAIWLIESPKREDGTGQAILNQAKL